MLWKYAQGDPLVTSYSLASQVADKAVKRFGGSYQNLYYSLKTKLDAVRTGADFSWADLSSLIYDMAMLVVRNTGVGKVGEAVMFLWDFGNLL